MKHTNVIDELREIAEGFETRGDPLNGGWLRKVADEMDRLRLDKDRLDWLGDPANASGLVQLPTASVERHPGDLRAAIDDAMAGPFAPAGEIGADQSEQLLDMVDAEARG